MEYDIWTRRPHERIKRRNNRGRLSWIKHNVTIIFSVAATLVARPLYSQQLVEQAREVSGQDSSINPGAPRCVWVAAWASWSNDHRVKTSLRQLKEDFKYNGKRALPGCFGSFWKPLCPGWKGAGVLTERDGSIVRYGACKVGQIDKPDSGALRLADFLGVPVSDRIIHTTVYNSFANSKNQAWLWTQNYATWGMNSECKYVPLTSSTQLCGFAGVSWSPISLILDESTSLDADMTVVDFSLDINQPDSYSLWKGSEKAPLLVYDPTRSGEVANATRLFGNYTFGGRTAELSRMKLDSQPERLAWKNGYEALALLDTNRDGKVAGAELESLGLWFDANRDAHSDAGEVRSLASAGIIALYYKNPSGQGGSKDIGLSIGYERVVDGRIVQGRSVDWYGETFSSKVEAVQALGALFSGQASSSM